MAQRDRTLDVLVVGLGRGGGRIAGEFARRGYRSIVFHSSKKAMEEQRHVPEERRTFIGADRQAHTRGDANVGRLLIREHARRIENAIRIEARDADMILLTAGLGGGTGSAIGQFLQSFDRREVPVVGLVTLPSSGQPPQRKTNALRAVQELTRAELDGLVIIDDGRLAERESNLSVLDFYNRVNEQIAAPFDALNQLDSREDLSPVRGIQANRLHQILTRGGVVAYGSRAVDDLELETIGTQVMSILCDGELVAGGLDPASIGVMQIALVASKATLEATPVRLVEALREHWKTQSPGASVDVAIYRGADDATPSLHAIASCASLPARLDEMIEQTAAETEAWRQKAFRPPVLDLSRLDEIDDPPTGSFRSSPPPERPKASEAPLPAPPASPRVSSAPIAARPSVGASSAPIAPPPSAPPPSAPPPSAPPPSAPPPASPSSPPHSISAPSNDRNPPIGNTPPGHETTSVEPDPRAVEAAASGPGKAVFARLVTRYKSSTNPELQRAIARRLEQDRLSEDPRIRLLAVDAMGKIGAHVFDGALFAATEDDNDEVRAAAERALGSRPG
ncbi:MAG: hypothetical protein AB7S26_36575 [Sandaracinaceae bacterium]